MIKTGSVFNALLSCCLRHVPEYLVYCLPIRAPKSGKGHPLPSTSANYKKLKGVIKIFLQNILHLLEKVSQPDTDVFVLRQLLQLCRYFACFPKLNRLLLKLLLKRWSQGEEGVRVAAFLAIRKCAIVSPHPFIELALKGIYLTFIRNCKFSSANMRPTLTFMMNSVVELYRLDEVASYQHAFVYIRQLAIHLRNASLAKKKDSHLQVYNWQYLYAIRVWTKLLAEEVPPGSKEGLQPLIYPLVQVVMGVIQLIPTPRYYPYRFNCIQSLILLVEKTGVYIPLANAILDTLDSTEMKKRPAPSTSKPLVFENILKVPKSNLSTPQFQEAVLNLVNACSLRYFAAISYSIGFPECTFPVIVHLRKIVKASKASSVAKIVKPLIEKMEETAKYIQHERANVTFGPKDINAMETWSAVLKDKAATPVARHYKVWCTADAHRQRKMAAVQHVSGDDFRKQGRRDRDADSEESDEDNGFGASLAKRKTAKENGAATKKREKHKPAKKAAVEESLSAHDDDDDDNNNDDDNDDDDVLGDFSMKEFEFDEDSE